MKMMKGLVVVSYIIKFTYVRKNYYKNIVKVVTNTTRVYVKSVTIQVFV